MGFNFIGGEFKENAKQLINLIRGWRYFSKTEVVVGITDETNVERDNGMSNASLLYLHENGVPSHNIPPRPVLRPAIAEDGTKQKIEMMMKTAAEEAIVHGNTENAQKYMERAGMVGRDACKNYITKGGKLAPNAESTIRKKGSSTPLVDTASMLNSITYAVRKKK